MLNKCELECSQLLTRVCFYKYQLIVERFVLHQQQPVKNLVLANTTVFEGLGITCDHRKLANEQRANSRKCVSGLAKSLC